MKLNGTNRTLRFTHCPPKSHYRPFSSILDFSKQLFTWLMMIHVGGGGDAEIVCSIFACLDIRYIHSKVTSNNCLNRFDFCSFWGLLFKWTKMGDNQHTFSFKDWNFFIFTHTPKIQPKKKSETLKLVSFNQNSTSHTDKICFFCLRFLFVPSDYPVLSLPKTRKQILIKQHFDCTNSFW